MSDSDVSLPKSTMLKIIKERLPADMKLAADAGETMIRCCDEFVQMLSSTANEISDKEGRTTILPEHVLKAVEQLGFDSFLQHMNEGGCTVGQWAFEPAAIAAAAAPCTSCLQLGWMTINPF